MSTFPRVSPGTSANKSPTRQSAWINAVSQSAEHYLQQVANGEVRPGPQSPHRIVNPVKCKNLTGANRVRGAVVQLGDYLLTTFDPRNPWFQGNAYDDSVERRIAILEKAAIGDDIVEVCVAGHCVARVDVTDTGHRFAEPSDGLFVLKSAAAGAIEIISPVVSTGEQELFVVIGGGSGSTLRWGEATTTIAAATSWGSFGSGTVQPKDDAGVNDGSPITVENRFWDSFLNKSIVCYDSKYTPARIVSVGCTPAT